MHFVPVKSIEQQSMLCVHRLREGYKADRERLGWQKAALALANKNARILWAVMTKGDAFDAKHVSVKPEITTSNKPAFAAA